MQNYIFFSYMKVKIRCFIRHYPYNTFIILKPFQYFNIFVHYTETLFTFAKNNNGKFIHKTKVS